MKNKAFVGLALMATAVVAQAGTLQADWNYELGITNVRFTGNMPGLTGATTQGTTRFRAVRTGGTDTILPSEFRSYCAEIGEPLAEGNRTHANVSGLLGSTTTSGGISGPVFFDATRTTNLSKLWGTYFNSIGNDASMSAAFQLAQWEIAFDDDLTLVEGTGSRMWVASGQEIAGISDLAESWLTSVRDGSATAMSDLVLISGDGIQDQIAAVPEPGTIAAVGLGTLALLRRRKRA